MTAHTPGPAQPGPAPPSPAPPAPRLSRRRLFDPRLLTGIVLVAVAVVAGAMIIEASDDTTTVWALRVDVHGGGTPNLSDLERVDVHVGASVGERYLSGTDEAVARRLEGRAWAHDVPAGELLALSALTGRDRAGGELPLSVALGSMPGDLRSGQWVDVWVGPGRSGRTQSGDQPGAEQVLRHVRVRGVREPSAVLGQGAARTVLVGLDEATADNLGTVLARIGGGEVTLVRVSGES